MGDYHKMIQDYGIELGVVALAIIGSCFACKFCPSCFCCKSPRVSTA